MGVRTAYGLNESVSLKIFKIHIDILEANLACDAKPIVICTNSSEAKYKAKSSTPTRFPAANHLSLTDPACVVESAEVSVHIDLNQLVEAA